MESVVELAKRGLRLARRGPLLVLLVAACGGSSSGGDAGTDGGASGGSARELCIEALSHTSSCIAATGSTQMDCELEIGDFLAAGCRAEVEASLSCLSTHAPDPDGFCPACETEQRAVSSCLTR